MGEGAYMQCTYTEIGKGRPLPSWSLQSTKELNKQLKYRIPKCHKHGLAEPAGWKTKNANRTMKRVHSVEQRKFAQPEKGFQKEEAI